MAIKEFELENFGPLKKVHGQSLGSLNLIIGANSTGKTFLLKALYMMLRSQEETGRGDDPRDFDEVLSEKCYWTFQVDKLGDLVRRGAGNRLKARMVQDDNCALVIDFGQDTTKRITPVHNNLGPREANSVFLPPKEVLSLAKVIIKSGLHDKAFGFDATYTDLVLALQKPTQMGRNYDAFKQSRISLEKMFQGRIEFDAGNDSWVYRKGNSRFSIHSTAEGIKKIAILDTLLGNRYLSPDSIIFIDEPESALHPKAISQFLDILAVLAEKGIQVFMASHSYFVVKKLHLLALQNNISIPVLMGDSDDGWQQADLKDGIPENGIIDESIRLFELELEASA
ncbi:AAA family ATPase [Marinobacterium iners]|uniref:AAA family ATPase n=1 Tax=Marinobacterium iners TaxID=48076 RepID=UPI001A8F20BB|nr:ATP-binding protein [Marinobacterium iners]